MRGLKTTIGLLVVLGGLGGYIYYDSQKKPADDPSVSKLEKVFAGLQSDKVDEETLRRPCLRVRPNLVSAPSMQRQPGRR